VSDLRAKFGIPGGVGTGSTETALVALRVPDPSNACEGARQNNGRTSLLSDAPKLPFKDCGRIDCRCRYERITDRRRGQRRQQADRREEIRFELKKEDRRKTDRRRSNSNPWSRDL
jgi:hypothetical protein